MSDLFRASSRTSTNTVGRRNGARDPPGASAGGSKSACERWVTYRPGQSGRFGTSNAAGSSFPGQQRPNVCGWPVSRFSKRETAYPDCSTAKQQQIMLNPHMYTLTRISLNYFKN
jgi:hypothetical protein